MLATLTDKPFDDPAWVFETKWDGFRAIAVAAPGHATLYSRNGNDISRNNRVAGVQVYLEQGGSYCVDNN